MRRAIRRCWLLVLLALLAGLLHVVYSALWMIVMLWLFALGQG